MLKITKKNLNVNNSNNKNPYLFFSNAAIMTNRWDLDIERNPGAHKALNPIFLTINQELRYIKTIVTKVRSTIQNEIALNNFYCRVVRKKCANYT